jgi:hypothetical protein
LAGSTHPGAAGERAAALAGLGRVPEAIPIADSLLARRDTLAPWDSLLAGLGRHDREAASGLVDRIAAVQEMPPALRSRLLLADADRWRGVDSTRREARLAEAATVGQGTPLAGEARFAVVLDQVRNVEEISQLLEDATSLDDMGEESGPVAPRAAQLAALVRRVAVAADSAPAGAPRGDLRLFVAGEMARDSLGADRFAARQFRRVAAEWPASPFAPKALLALLALEPDQGDSLRATLLTNYPASPYVTLTQGGESPEYAVLEDSLRRFAAGFRPEARRIIQPNRPTRPQPSATPREPVNR